jgi:hypothetical protein
MSAKKSPVQPKPKAVAKKRTLKSEPTGRSRPTTVKGYLESLPPDRRAVIAAGRKFVQANVPKGYTEFMNWGVINWGIPLTQFPNTYNGQPFTYVALAANKHNVSLHLMGCYANPKQIDFLRDEFKKAGKKFDMGKSCLHFRTLDDLDLKSVAKVIGSVTPAQFLAMYKKVKGLN